MPTRSAAEIARRLHGAEADVSKAPTERRRLAVDVDGQRYPAFQSSTDGIRPGVREVLVALAGVPVTSDWVRLDVFTAPGATDDGPTVAELLHDGEVRAALAVVRRSGATGR